MRPNVRTLPNTANKRGTYTGAGTAVSVDTIQLPLDFALQRIFLEINGTVDLSGASTLVEDALQSLFSEIRMDLTGDDGVVTVFKMSGADLYIKNFYDYEQSMPRVAPSAMGNGQTVALALCIDFRLAKNNPDDYSVAIPLYAYSSADLILNWDTAANGYGTNSSNWSLTARVTLYEAIPENAEEKAAFLKNPLLKQFVKAVTTDSSTGTEEERDTDITVGNIIRRILLIAKTSGNARSDTVIESYSIYTAILTFFKQVQFYASQTQDKIDYRIPTYDGNRTYKGVTILDFARSPVDESGSVLGFNSIGFKQGDLKIALNKNSASAKVRYVHEVIVQ